MLHEECPQVLGGALVEDGGCRSEDGVGGGTVGATGCQLPLEGCIGRILSTVVAVGVRVVSIRTKSGASRVTREHTRGGEGVADHLRVGHALQLGHVLKSCAVHPLVFPHDVLHKHSAHGENGPNL